MYDCEIGRAMNDEIILMEIDDTCGVVGCDNLEYKVSWKQWNKDHPQCTPVALCKEHYDLY